MDYSTNSMADANSRVRLVIVARRQLDADALAALCQAHAEFSVLSATNDIQSASVLCRHRRPDAVLLDARLISGGDRHSTAWALEPFGDIPILLLDDDINEARLASILQMPRIGYFTRRVKFVEIAAGIRRLVRGERAFGPLVEERLQQTPAGWQLRRDQPRSPFAILTPREVEVLRLIALGHTIKDCALQLQLSPSTVDNHKSRLMKKLDVHRSIDLTRLAVREGLIRL
jgi:two-component system invasion response regulator UvrY